MPIRFLQSSLTGSDMKKVKQILFGGKIQKNFDLEKKAKLWLDMNETFS